MDDEPWEHLVIHLLELLIGSITYDGLMNGIWELWMTSCHHGWKFVMSSNKHHLYWGLQPYTMQVFIFCSLNPKLPSKAQWPILKKGSIAWASIKVVMFRVRCQEGIHSKQRRILDKLKHAWKAHSLHAHKPKAQTLYLHLLTCSLGFWSRVCKICLRTCHTCFTWHPLGLLCMWF